MFRELVKHWWNGRWGRMARRDVYVRTDGTRFELELRAGGTEGRSARAVFDRLDDALGEAASRMGSDPDWRDVTDAHQR